CACSKANTHSFDLICSTPCDVRLHSPLPVFPIVCKSRWEIVRSILRGARRFRRQHHRLDVGAKALPWHQSINRFERIALRRQCRQSLLRIEKPQLTDPRLPDHVLANETRTALSKRLFLEVPLCLPISN